MLKNFIHTGLFVVAVLMLVVGAIGGTVWGVHALFGDALMETEMEVRIGTRVLCVLLCGGAGLFSMLSFWNYQQQRRDRWKDNKG